MGCDPVRRTRRSAIGCFNPRTHVGCDGGERNVIPNPRVSIHAPTWGATLSHAPWFRHCKFQSTHPRGVRPDVSFVLKILVSVSIHAPTWGATLCRCRSAPSTCFNPRTHVGCDSENPQSSRFSSRFQSTHPRGVRRAGLSSALTPECFNPRTHVGCDR